MRNVRAVAWRHPLAANAGLAVLVAVANTPTAADTGLAGGGWLWFAAVHLPLLWRRQAPVAVFWAVFVTALAVWAAMADAAYPMIVILVALFAVARHRSPLALWPAVAAVEVALVGAWLPGDLRWRDLVAMTAVLTATVLLGVNLRARGAHLAAREERARRLEHERAQQAMLATTAERARIAREIHDIVAHNLAVMVALADGAALTAATAPQRAADTLATVSATGRQALGEMQRLLDLLRDGEAARADPPGLTPQPGLDDIDELVEQVRAAGLRIALTRQGMPGGWGPGAGLAVYRIVQEALTNTIKHAGPTAAARVRLCFSATAVDLEVTDHGGPRPESTPRPGERIGGHGLAGMVERAAAYGGRVEAGPLPGGGWRVSARLHFDDGAGST